MNVYKKITVNSESEIPLIVQLTQQITWLIASGELNSGDHLPPMREMANRLGVHMHTVRIAYQRLEADMLVSIRTRHGTEVRPFDPGNIAEKHSENPSNLMGVLLPAPGSVYNTFLQGVHQAASENHSFPLICYTYDNPITAERYINQLIAKQVDGFIVTSTNLISIFNNPELIDKFPPIVFVDAPDMPTNTVLINSKDAAYQATKHLLEHGYKQIGLITAPLNWANVYECYLGYEQALAEFDISPDPNILVEVPSFQRQNGYEAMRELLRRDKPPRAVFVIADTLSLGAIEAINDHGLRIPEDIALASYNNIEQAALVNPGLTTANLPAFEMGEQAVKMLQKLLAGRKLKQPHIVLDSELVIRQSCGCKE